MPWLDRRTLVKIALAAILVSLVGWFYASGTYEQIDTAQIRDWLRRSGPIGAILFVVAYACLQPFGVNGLFFLLSAPLVWSPTQAFLLNWAGTVGTGFTSFALARFLARDWVQKRLPPRVRRFDERLYTDGFRTVLLLRLVFYTTPTVQYALGVSRVDVSKFVAGTIVGVAPFTLLMTLLGVRISAWLEQHPVATWPWDTLAPVLVAVGIVVVTAIIVFVRRWRARAET